MSIPAEPDLTAEERIAVSRAAKQFNAGLYFECHDTLEEVWSGLRGPARDFFQGLIQVSVGFHQLDRGNDTGALGMFTKALGRFEAYPVRYFGFDVAAERERLRELLGAHAGRGIVRLPQPPSWRFEGLPATDQRAPD